jgi:hypothetical protein
MPSLTLHCHMCALSLDILEVCCLSLILPDTIPIPATAQYCG